MAEVITIAGEPPLMTSWGGHVLELLNHSDLDTIWLERCLDGTDNPGIDNYTEGHVWLLRAVKDSSAGRLKLAKLAAVLLGKFTEANDRNQRYSNRVLWNLFFLAAGLKAPSVLSAPLRVIFDRGLAGANPSGKELDLRHALRAALIHNQDDMSLLPEWMSLLERRTSKFIGGPRDGFDGFLELPIAPSYKIVTQALDCMNVYLQDDPRKAYKSSALRKAAFERFGVLIEIVSDHVTGPDIRATDEKLVVTTKHALTIYHQIMLKSQIGELVQNYRLELQKKLFIEAIRAMSASSRKSKR